VVLNGITPIPSLVQIGRIIQNVRGGTQTSCWSHMHFVEAIQNYRPLMTKVCQYQWSHCLGRVGLGQSSNPPRGMDVRMSAFICVVMSFAGRGPVKGLFPSKEPY